MSFHKKLLAATLLLTSTAAFAGPSSAPDLRLDVSGNKPHNDENWESSSVGFTAQALFWQTKDFAVATSLGMQKYKANTDEYNNELVGITGQLEGDARVSYLGVSAIQRIPLKNDFSLQGEAGVRYARVSSSVDLSYSGDAGTVTDKVEMESGFLGLLAADLVMKMNSQISLLAGGGLQFDITKGHAKAFGDSDKNTLGSSFLRVGAQFSF